MLCWFVALQFRRLDSNALVCDCGILWLSDMLKTGHMQAAVTCEAPEDAAGKPLLSITENIRCSKFWSDNASCSQTISMTFAAFSRSIGCIKEDLDM